MLRSSHTKVPGLYDKLWRLRGVESACFGLTWGIVRYQFHHDRNSTGQTGNKDIDTGGTSGGRTWMFGKSNSLRHVHCSSPRQA